MGKFRIGVYEAGVLNTLLQHGSVNLYAERAGDGQYLAIKLLLKHKWIAEDKKGIHHLLKVTEARLEAREWFGE